jgi:CDGSH-type Zn-finger protein/truncated hemoglobin YjbI
MTNGDGAPDGTPDGAPDQPVQAAGQGRLARVLATRGGKAAPEAPFVIEHREALIYMLCEAAELEHGIMCQYLFAAFSLKQAAAEGLTPPQLAAVTRWRKQVSHVATQEMLHLALVHNLLSAIGAAPHLARPNLPQPADHYPAGVQLALLPFGEQALRHFMFLERPEGMDLQDAAGMAAVGRAEPMMSERDIVPRRQDFATVGHLYRSIEAGIAGLVAAHGEDWLFVGPPRAQATQAHFRWPELVAVTDAASAQRAIDTILEQGEGPRGDWRNAHFGQFVAILDEYEEMTQADPAFDPVRPVVAANVRPPERAVNVPLISDPLTARVTDLFNVGYEVLLQIFERYFAHTQETDVQLKVLADATVALMLQVIKPLGDLITTLPVGPDQPGSNAGPSFELFYETDYLMPHRDAAWALLTERLDEAAWLCEALREGRGAQIGQHLEPVLAALRQLARTLAAHLPAGSAQARQALQPEPLAPARIDALTAQADVLARGVAGVTRQDEVGSGLAAVFDLAHAALTAAAGPWSPGHVAPRLADSVLRPLADALARYPGEPGVPAVGVPAGGATAGGATAGGATAVGGGQSAPRAADELVWQAAQAATRLLARLGVADSAPPQAGPAQAGLPELAEATAALQDLACGLAPAPERAGRLATLRQLQSGLPALIQTAKDGPYLVTNVPRLLNYLGEPVAATPQVALCRCGGSSMKPLCDGTHARIGFSDVKDPKRVPDRRDSYVGQQVTILDNRGLCQHSGYCTDRLPAAFRTGQEPFVAPSGGRMDEIIRAARDCPSGALSFAIEGRAERDIVDWGGHREPAIEVTRDGPYRITGGIMLVGADGIEVERNAGASREHCALCRCGHSQNKPFCSGMHWYVGFRDPVPDPGHEPTLFEWAGGLPALTRMTRLLYEKHVPADDLLAPLFASMPPEHPRREAMWLAEVFGGPAWYSADRDGADRDGADRDGADPDGQDPGGSQQMTVAHAGRSLDERQRARWVALASRAADEAGLPADAQFRSAFAAYLDWGSRVAVGMSQPGGAPAGDAAVPRWGWTAAGPPDTAGTVAAGAVPAGTVPAGTVPGADQAGQPTPLPGPGEAVSFGVHIKPLFRASDRQSMSFAFDLWSCGDARTHAADILDRLRGGSMPCDGAWPGAKVDVFQRWVDSGMEA